jgi:hypothetical protein
LERDLTVAMSFPSARAFRLRRVLHMRRKQSVSTR